MSMNTILTAGFVLGAAYLISTGKAKEILDQLSQQIGQMVPAGGGGGDGGGLPFPQLPAPAPPSGGGGGGGGPISGGGTCPGGGITLHDDSQGGSNRMEAGNGVAWDAYEVTWCGTFSGDDLTFKMYGPSHSGSNCCWCVLHVKEDGSMVPGGEGPHPGSNCEHPSGSKGGGGEAPCYKAVMRPGPIQEGYALVGGQWQLRASYQGPCGCDQKASKRTGDTLMVRNDGQMTTQCATVRPLGAGGGGGPAAPAPAPEGGEGAQSGALMMNPYQPYSYEFMPHVASEDESYTSNRLPGIYSPDYFTGAGPITPATPQPKSWEHVYKAKPKPKPVLKSRFSPKTTYRPIRGQQTRQGSQVHQQHARTVAQWKSVADIPPATRRMIQNSWVARARRLALARLAAMLNARRRSGYQTVGYSGGFGGTIAPTVPGITGAMGANAYSAYEEAMGLKPLGNETQLSAAQKNMSNTANGAIQDFINCKDNKTCRAAAVRKFDQIVMSRSNSVASGFPQLRGQFDPSQAQV